MQHMKYINGLLDRPQVVTAPFHDLAAPGDALSSHIDVIKSTMTCVNGCKENFGLDSSPRNVRFEIEPSSPMCHLPTQPSAEGLFPSVYIPGSTVLIVLIVLREVRRFRLVGIAEGRKDRAS